MRRLNKSEVGVLVVALVFVIVGMKMILFPEKVTVTYPGGTMGIGVHLSTFTENISENGMRFYGLVGVLIGCCFGCAVLLGKKK